MMPGARVHGSSPNGKLVVTLDADSADEMLSRVGEIQRTDGVLSAALVIPVLRHGRSDERGDPRCPLTDGTSSARRPLPPPVPLQASRLPGIAQQPRWTRASDTTTGLKWSKAPCRFCGTGCGVTVAVKDNRVVATHGDPQAEVNRGLNCVKGYFLSKIMYGDDRLLMPLLRMKNGKYAKDGEFKHRLVGPGLRRDGRPVQTRAEGEGPHRRGHVRLGPVDVWEGYARVSS